MRIAVIGAGAVGSYFGGRLAVAGADVTFVARGGRADAMRRRGLCIAGSLGAFAVPRPSVVSDPREILHAADIVLLCVKTYDTGEAMRAVAESPSGGAVVLSLQNGVDAVARLSRQVARPVAGLAFVSASLTEAGDVLCVGTMSSIAAGRFPADRAGLEAGFRQACAAAGFGCDIVSDIDDRLWRKFVLLSTNAALTALSRSPAGFVYHDPDMRRVARAAIDEAIAVANAEGVAIEPQFAEAALAQASGFPAGMYASMAHDLRSGRRLELDHLSGHLVRLADRHGLAVPVHRTAYAALKPFAAGRIEAQCAATECAGCPSACAGGHAS